MIARTFTWICLSLLLVGCQPSKVRVSDVQEEVQLVVLDPGHFHAALVQKSMLPQMNRTAYVYAPEGPDVLDFMDRIEGFNQSGNNPADWRLRTYTGPDYLEQMLADKPGNVVVVSGNNSKKTDYILSAVQAGLNVLADKPMVISAAKFPLLEEAFQTAQANDVQLYDIMTERYEITSILQKELAHIPSVFGTLQPGTPRKPAITKESVHHFFKQVAGKPIQRPGWFFDETQRGEALVDVSTHLVDLIQWACFPEQIITYPEDIRIIAARRLTTRLSPTQFTKITQERAYPAYLRRNVVDGNLRVYSGGEMVYRIKGVVAKVSVAWNYEAPPGTGDTHYSIMRGTKCNLVIRQGAEEQYQPTLYIEALEGQEIEMAVMRAVRRTLQARYAGIGLRYLDGGRWIVTIPERYKIGHEAHFAQVTEKYLDYLANGTMPAWEVPNMLAKYYITTEALKLAKK